MTVTQRIPASQVTVGMRISPDVHTPCGTVTKVALRDGYNNEEGSVALKWLIFDLQEGGFFAATHDDLMYVST